MANPNASEDEIERVAASYLDKPGDPTMLTKQEVFSEYRSWSGFMMAHGLIPFSAYDCQEAVQISREEKDDKLRAFEQAFYDRDLGDILFYFSKCPKNVLEMVRGVPLLRLGAFAFKGETNTIDLAGVVYANAAYTATVGISAMTATLWMYMQPSGMPPGTFMLPSSFSALSLLWPLFNFLFDFSSELADVELEKMQKPKNVADSQRSLNRDKQRAMSLRRDSFRAAEEERDNSMKLVSDYRARIAAAKKNFEALRRKGRPQVWDGSGETPCGRRFQGGNSRARPRAERCALQTRGWAMQHHGRARRPDRQRACKNRKGREGQQPSKT